MPIRQPNSDTYEAVAEGDDEERTLSNEPIKDTPESEHAEDAATETEEIPIGSLSRNEHQSWYYLGHGAVDALLTLGPVLFLVVPAMCLGLNNQAVSPYGEKVKAITLLSPTMFPIIYAAILGKMLRRIGLFKAERGTTVGDLERLIGCQSIFTAFERQISLRRFDVLGIAILLSWLLSPVGGQASLRLLSTKPQITSHNSTVQYYPMENYPEKSFIRSPEVARQGWPVFAPLYMSAIQTSRQILYAPTDIFGNVKIPDINILSRNDNQVADQDYRWYAVTNNTLEKYTSIIGIPVIGTTEARNSSFNIVSHYWAISCGLLKDNWGRTAWQPDFSANTSQLSDNKTISPTFQLQVDNVQNDAGNINFKYVSRKNVSVIAPWTVSAACSASPRVVESQVKCHNGACGVRAIRRVNRDAANVWGGYAPLLAFRNIAQWMPGADLGFSQGVANTSEFIEHWMRDPYLGSLGGSFVHLDTMAPHLFNLRLQVAINTFWDASTGSSARVNSMQHVDDFKTWTNASAQFTEYKGEVYECSTVLAVITIAISLSLFVAANVSTLLGLFTRTPDILGFVSVSARDNPYFKQHVTSYLSGLETARALRDVRVRVGDVKSAKNVGHIAFATLDMGPKKLS